MAEPKTLEVVSSRYQHELSSEVSNSLAIAASYVPAKAKVLDVGTGAGAFARHLKGLGSTVYGCDLEDAWNVSKSGWCEEWRAIDLERESLSECFAGKRFDVVSVLDVLEHLKQPERVLAGARKLLNDDGRLVISIPNAAHTSVVAQLMLNNFPYAEEGLLDKTHIRFFTRRSIEALLEANGFFVERIERVVIFPRYSEMKTDYRVFPPEVGRYLEERAESSTYQFVILARPATEATRLAALSSKAEQLETQLRDAQLQNQSIVQERQQAADHLRAELAQRTAELTEERAHGVRQVAELQSQLTAAKAVHAELPPLQRALEEERKKSAVLPSYFREIGMLHQVKTEQEARITQMAARINELERQVTAMSEALSSRTVRAFHKVNHRMRELGLSPGRVARLFYGPRK